MTAAALLADVANESRDAVDLIKRVGEQSDAQRLLRSGCMPRDLAQQMPFLVLMEHREVIGQQHELLGEDRADRVEQAGEARLVDAPIDGPASPRSCRG